MLASRFLKPDHGRKHGRFYDVTERYFDGMLKLYDKGLVWTLARRRLTMAVSAVILVATVFLFLKIPKGFLPSEDTGQVFGFTEGVQGISFGAMGEPAGSAGRRPAAGWRPEVAEHLDDAHRTTDCTGRIASTRWRIVRLHDMNRRCARPRRRRRPR